MVVNRGCIKTYFRANERLKILCLFTDMLVIFSSFSTNAFLYKICNKMLKSFQSEYQNFHQASKFKFKFYKNHFFCYWKTLLQRECCGHLTRCDFEHFPIKQAKPNRIE